MCNSLLPSGASPTYTGDCDAGHHCIIGSFVANPIDGVRGRLCPEGGFNSIFLTKMSSF